ncbi:MAG: hypothetical protein J7J93_02005 [Candidatus Aenigmarchaeota archaeon]|nr:hypothetical protein [Candidatus Aenigmarchaeota archaeon]
MKNLIIASLVAAIMVAAPVFATTYMQTKLNVPTGQTNFYQKIETQGQWYGDGDGGSWSGKFSKNGKTTAFSEETFQNDNSLVYMSSYQTTKPYKSMRQSHLVASGITDHTYTYKARSLCAGKPQDVTWYNVYENVHTPTSDMPALNVWGSAPGYGGNNGNKWNTAVTLTHWTWTNEPVHIYTFDTTNPQL